MLVKWWYSYKKSLNNKRNPCDVLKNRHPLLSRVRHYLTHVIRITDCSIRVIWFLQPKIIWSPPCSPSPSSLLATPMAVHLHGHACVYMCCMVKDSLLYMPCHVSKWNCVNTAVIFAIKTKWIWSWTPKEVMMKLS